MKQLQFYLLAICILFASNSYSQLQIDAEIRPRYENRNGYKTLIPKGENAASFVSQRTRLATKYTSDNLSFYVNLQNVRVWGDVPQLNKSDENGIGLHEAWGKISFNPNFSIKLGRQEVVYDDSRIFGNVGWAQQARSHDMALVHYTKNKFKFQAGFAYNQSSERLTGTQLDTPKTYKAMQHLWFHKDWDHVMGSFLFLNNGMQDVSGSTKYSQTIGTHIKTKGKSLQFMANLYYQFGKDVANRDLSAHLLGMDVNYKLADNVKIGAGAELQSGNKNGAPSSKKNKAFTPFYGTNQKFNGFMDYFYVGNHANNVGLLNLYSKAHIKTSPKTTLSVFIHNFSAAADLQKNLSNQLGTELDLVYKYKFSPEVGFSFGYSHMFAAKGMEVLKSNYHDASNYWAWAMVTIKPTLFSSKKE